MDFERLTITQVREIMEKCNKELSKRKPIENKTKIIYTCPHCTNRYSYHSFYRHKQSKTYLEWLNYNPIDEKINEKLNDMIQPKTLEILDNELKETEMLNNEK